MNLFKEKLLSLRKRKTLSDYLAETGLEEQDLQNIIASLEVDVEYLKDSQKSKLESEGNFELKEEVSNFSGMTILSCTSNAITIISALIALEKWIGSKY